MDKVRTDFNSLDNISYFMISHFMLRRVMRGRIRELLSYTDYSFIMGLMCAT